MKRGKFVCDGTKDAVLTSKNMSRLFDVPVVDMINKDGYYYVFGY